jgi:hypothetical protein
MKIIKIIITIIILVFAFSLIDFFRVNRINSDYKKQLIPLIQAIDNYYKKNDKYPTSINVLLPEYINVVPPINSSFDYKIHGKFYIISFKHKSQWYKVSKLWDVYWSKTKKWYISDFTEWPEK